MGDATQSINKKDIGLVAKIGMTIIFVVSFSVSLTGLLTYFNFTKSYSEINQARYLVLADSLKKSIEFSMNVGVDLEELNNAQTLVQEVADKNPDVLLLRIVSSNNKIVYEKQGNGKLLQQDFTDADFIKGTLNRFLETEAETYISVPIHNNFGEKAGELRIGYSREKTVDYYNKTAWYLFQFAVLSILIIAVIVMAAVHITTRKFRRRITIMQSALTGLLQDSSHDPEEITDAGNLELSYLAFHEKAQELFFSFDATRRDLDKLEAKIDHD